MGVLYKDKKLNLVIGNDVFCNSMLVILLWSKEKNGIMLLNLWKRLMFCELGNFGW